jgi:hypothetical protein
LSLLALQVTATTSGCRSQTQTQASGAALRASVFSAVMLGTKLASRRRVDYEVVDEVCVAPRVELRRLVERIIANVAAVLLWTARAARAPCPMHRSRASMRREFGHRSRRT